MRLLWLSITFLSFLSTNLARSILSSDDWYSADCDVSGIQDDLDSCFHYIMCDGKGTLRRMRCSPDAAWSAINSICETGITYLACVERKGVPRRNPYGVGPEKELGLTQQKLEGKTSTDDERTTTMTITGTNSANRVMLLNSISVTVPNSMRDRLPALAKGLKLDMEMPKDMLKSAPDSQATSPSNKELRLKRRQTPSPPPDINDTQPCFPGEVAYVADPDDCRKYTFCEGGFGQNFICPLGELFDTISEQCTAAIKATCGEWKLLSILR